MASVRYHGVRFATKRRALPARQRRARSRHPELSPCARRRRGTAHDRRPGVVRAWANERDPTLARALGDVLVVLPPRPTAALLRLVAVLRPRAVALLEGRPERQPSRRLRDDVAKILG